MARPAGQLQLAVVVALLMVAATAPSPVVSAVTCGQVVGYLTPCISYAMGRGTAPPEACCSGIRSLNTAARTTADRQATCNCLKQVTATMPGLKPDIVAGIPSKCGVAIPYPIRRTTDCSK
ncbi:Non-specific lipid-transfer protein 4 [Dichanthelium oligosanthes]|uniref:Non-specific lipid-transfer protein n=1 Tax=Dichanthelium oligosanthes TaxID=888268 RepID=A0A1E5VNX9_9POAL|nr:Non-specific lipid-transfer protein 4 [Dichanthelium oligosanthes]